MSEQPAIVIDNGSGLIKAGMSGEDAPKVKLPTVVSGDSDNPLVGKSAEKGENSRFPYKHGRITNWDDMEKIWQHTFDELRVKPQDRSVLLTEAPLNPEPNREKIIQIMFETFNVRNFYLSVSGVLSLYASGHTTGVDVDIGYDTVSVVPIYEGYCLPHGVQQLYIGGKDLTEHLLTRLRSQVRDAIRIERETIQSIKEQLCFVADDFDNDTAEEKSYTLPGGEVIYLAEEQNQCPEALFKPSIVHVDSDGINKKIYNSIIKCDRDIRRDLFNHINLSGGSSMFVGLADRLQKELGHEASSTNIKVVANPERKYYAWIGGSVLSSLSTFEKIWIPKDEYDEAGPNIVHKKSF